MQSWQGQGPKSRSSGEEGSEELESSFARETCYLIYSQNSTEEVNITIKIYSSDRNFILIFKKHVSWSQV